MKTFLRNFSERRKNKKKLVNGWVSKVSKKDARNYRVRHYWIYLGHFVMTIFLIGSLSIVPEMVAVPFEWISSLEGYQRGTAVMVFFCFYLFFSGSIIFAASRGQRATGNDLNSAYLRVFPSWVGELAIELQVDNLIKGRNRFLITGFLLSFICPLLAFSGWNDIQDFPGTFLASVFSYISLIALAVVSYYISLKVKYFSILAYLAMAFIFLVSVLSMAGPKLLMVLDFCFHAFPPYWFFLDGGL